MSYGMPEVEHDIQNRTRWLAEALAAKSGAPDGFCAARDAIIAQAASTPPPVDIMTWFAMERLAIKAGIKAVRMENYKQPIEAGCLVWVSPLLEVNPGDVAELGKASLVIAGDEWQQALEQARSASAGPRKAPRP
jgi:hypothetical protein